MTKEDEEDLQEDLSKGIFFSKMAKFWYGGHEDFDALFEAFVPVIRDAAAGKLPSDPWETTVNGLLAQVLLADQFARNAFRGTPEAYAYDAFALSKSKRLVAKQCGIGKEEEDGDDVMIKGRFYVPYVLCLAVPYMHSENGKDHEEEGRLLEWANAHRNEQEETEMMQKVWKGLEWAYTGHKEVIDRFGRYPHRNKKLGRESTPEELEWLADTENLPPWAKSQL
mmetsp:Transcript_18944/g.44091  ORF Transcript_18944/g.44091 Transcript_18944/m.44091 type:complete len:224 (-) Transcript_18944:124-795(-)